MYVSVFCCCFLLLLLLLFLRGLFLVVFVRLFCSFFVCLFWFPNFHEIYWQKLYYLCYDRAHTMCKLFLAAIHRLTLVRPDVVTHLCVWYEKRRLKCVDMLSFMIGSANMIYKEVLKCVCFCRLDKFHWICILVHSDYMKSNNHFI